MAQLVDRLREAGAAVTAFDVMFAEPGPHVAANAAGAADRGRCQRRHAKRLLSNMPEPDAQFAEKMARGMPVVIGYSLVGTGGKPTTAIKSAPPSSGHATKTPGSS